MIILKVREGWVMVTKNRRKNGIKRKQEVQGRYNYRGGYGRACAKGSNWLQKGFAQCGSLDQNGQNRRTLTDVKVPPTNHSASIQIWPVNVTVCTCGLILQNSPQHVLFIRLFNVLNSATRVIEDIRYRSKFSGSRHQMEMSGHFVASAALAQWNQPLIITEQNTRQGDVLWRQ